MVQKRLSVRSEGGAPCLRCKKKKKTQRGSKQCLLPGFSDRVHLSVKFLFSLFYFPLFSSPPSVFSLVLD